MRRNKPESRERERERRRRRRKELSLSGANFESYFGENRPETKRLGKGSNENEAMAIATATLTKTQKQLLNAVRVAYIYFSGLACICFLFFNSIHWHNYSNN